MKQVYKTAILPAAALFLFSFFYTGGRTVPAAKIKAHYLLLEKDFILAAKKLQGDLASGDEKKLQQDFFSLRRSYKKIEPIVEYYFGFYATKLNGPPIPFLKKRSLMCPKTFPAACR